MQNLSLRVKKTYLIWLVVFISSAGILSSKPAYSQAVADYHQRADLLLENYLLKYWDGNYIRNTGEWTYIHGMDAVIDGAERTRKQKYYGLIETFYQAQDSRHGWLNDYYDDENWFVLTLIHAYEVTGEQKYLTKAEEIFKDIQETSWDDSCCGDVKGGLWWNKQHTQKATAANAGAVISALKLYEHTKKETYKSFGKQVYDFWWTNMVDTTTYQVGDHIKPDGTKVWWKFSYNEGLMIGASLEMYKAFSKTSYLSKARKIADFMINHETVPTPYGNVLSDGNANQCGGDCHQFKGPAYRYLMQLYRLDKNKKVYYRVLKASVEAFWNLARTSDNSVSVNWAGPVEPTAINDRTQNAAAQAMSLFALQNGPYPILDNPAGQYEAENATIKGVLLEASQPGYAGWGFVGGWNNTGTSVKFTVNNSTGGTKTVTLKYAAAAGDAVRNISVNGTPVTTLKFAGTADWNVYGTTTFIYDFPAGTSTILIDYNSNYVNLDNITIAATAARMGTQTEEKAPVLGVYPNPVRRHEEVKVTLYAPQATETNIRIFDVLGQSVFTGKKQLKKGSNTITLATKQLQPGSYVLYVTQGTHTETKKIIIRN